MRNGPLRLERRQTLPIDHREEILDGQDDDRGVGVQQNDNNDVSDTNDDDGLYDNDGVAADHVT
ncbi:hypothetical protein PanWU01x14_126220, partial [Parasponia andersonii]